MSKPQLARLSELLDQALPLTPTGRRRWLDSLPAEDRPLLQTLRDGLMMDDPEAALRLRLEKPARLHPTGAEEPAAPARQAGERLGPYELQGLLGVGGMAEVWLARRVDGVFDRQVALKIPRLGRLPQEMAERFTRERHILAALEHPGIARLYDAGVDDQGVPYFAMEYVQGKPLTTYCDAQGLDTAERLRVFLQVLEAVRHAHAQQVVHRDLKPSNILVTGDGDVRLLDFGVARLLQRDTAPALTRTYGRPLTPEYASPELLHGEAIDHGSDIYSLGVVLHELLVGMRPGQPGAVPRATLPAALRDIVRKATATLPGERYADVAEFAAALRRHAAGSGVPAYISRPTWRHGLAVVALLVLGAAGALLFRGQPAVPPVPPVPQLAGPATASIAVLPFVDLSEHGDQRYLSDGLAEELIGLLTKVPGLSVTARASSFAFRGRKDDVPAIAHQLNVAHVLDGSVRRSGDRLRFSVQLVQASTGTAIWSETYDGELKDVFDVQEEVANAVVSALKLRLLDKQSIPVSLRTQNTRAYEAYLLGRQYRDGFSLERHRRSQEAFEHAVELDPAFAAAHAALAMVTADIGGMTMDRGMYDRANAQAERALALDPALVEAHVARARVRMESKWDFTGAKADLDAAQRLDPNNPSLQQTLAYYLTVTGKPQEALVLQLRGVELNPLAGNRWSGLASTLVAVRDYAEARKALTRAAQLSSYSENYYQRARLELFSGNPAEALRVARMNPDEHRRNSTVALAAWSAGQRDVARAALQQLIDEVPEVFTAQIAIAYSWMDDREQAFLWLNRAIDINDPGLMEILTMQEFDHLRSDPRFRAALRRMNLAQ